MMDVLQQYFTNLGVPVLANYPLGHYKYNVTLPIGVLTEIDADNKLIRILESPTRNSE